MSRGKARRARLPNRGDVPVSSRQAKDKVADAGRADPTKVGTATRVRWTALLLGKLLALLCVAYVTFEVIFHNEAYARGETVLLVVVLLLGAATLAATYLLASARKGPLEQYFPLILAGFLLLMFVLQLVFGVRLRFVPTFDMDAVYTGAIRWTETGAIADYQDYFYYFPNNLGLLTFLKVFFSAGKALGITDYFLLGTILGACSVSLMMFSLVKICQKLLGVECAVTAMALLALCFPLYFAAAAFYSDVMSMAAPPLVYLLYLYAREAVTWKRRVGFYAGMALVAAIGMEIKFTVAILVIAVGITMLLKDDLRHFLAMAGIHIVVIAAVFALVNSAVYPGLLDREQAKRQNTPLTHWVMMGLKGNGGYNPEDYTFTRSFSDPEERDAAIRREIKERLSQMGLPGYLELLQKKTVADLGDGTYALSDFLDDGPVNHTALHDYILYAGPNYGSYRALCQGIFYLVYLLMLAGGVCGLLDYRRGKRWDLAGGSQAPFVPPIAFLGLWMFLMFWEASGRYFSNYISILLLCAMLGVSAIAGRVRRS